MVKLNCINQKACFINWVLQFYLYQNYVFHYFLDSILMVLLKFNNQNHLQFNFIFMYYYYYFIFSEILHIDIYFHRNVDLIWDNNSLIKYS